MVACGPRMKTLDFDGNLCHFTLELWLELQLGGVQDRATKYSACVTRRF